MSETLTTKGATMKQLPQEAMGRIDDYLEKHKDDDPNINIFENAHEYFNDEPEIQKVLYEWVTRVVNYAKKHSLI